MSENIGRNLKIVTKIFCYAEIIISVVIGIILLVGTKLFDISIFYALLLLIGGPLIFWLISLPLYGLGELIERSQQTSYACSEINDILVQMFSSEEEPLYEESQND